MPVDDYSAAVSGGLKLKGVNSSSKISKHKKKKAKPDSDPATADQSKEETVTQNAYLGADSTEGAALKKIQGSDDATEGLGDATPPPTRAGKTEAELRHEERRRKRVRFSGSQPSTIPRTMARCSPSSYSSTNG